MIGRVPDCKCNKNACERPGLNFRTARGPAPAGRNGQGLKFGTLRDLFHPWAGTADMSGVHDHGHDCDHGHGHNHKFNHGHDYCHTHEITIRTNITLVCTHILMCFASICATMPAPTLGSSRRANKRTTSQQ
jgi:hypothetical protein